MEGGSVFYHSGKNYKRFEIEVFELNVCLVRLLFCIVHIYHACRYCMRMSTSRIEVVSLPTDFLDF